MVHLFIALYQIGAGFKEITKLHGLIQNACREAKHKWKQAMQAEWKNSEMDRCKLENILLVTERI